MGVIPDESANKRYISIQNGRFAEPSKKEDLNAVERTWTDDDGKEHIKYELRHKGLVGYITGIKFYDGKFGEECVITLEDGDDVFNIQVKKQSDFFIDFGKKIPGVVLSEEVTLSPFDFVDENDRRRRGITITQGGVKIGNQYWDPEKKKLKGKFPDPDKIVEDKDDKDEWKVYFLKVRKFLKSSIEEMEFPKFEPIKGKDDSNDELGHGDLPF